MDRAELKQKIRKLKKLELKLRYGLSFNYITENASSKEIDNLPLVWKEFFSLHESESNTVRYSFNTLVQLEKDELKKIFDEYWFNVYFRMYQEKGIMMMEVQEPELLSYLGLPYDADKNSIKKRFRELCKTYHPDDGGDKDKFIELMDMMEKYDLK